MSNWQERMNKLKESWDAAKDQAIKGGFKTLDDGFYLAKITGADLGDSKAGRLQVTWDYLITEGESAGETHKSFDGCETEQNLVWLFRKIAMLGYDISAMTVEDINATLKDIAENQPLVRLRIKTNGDFQNTNIDRVVEESTTGGVYQTPAPEETLPKAQPEAPVVAPAPAPQTVETPVAAPSAPATVVSSGPEESGEEELTEDEKEALRAAGVPIPGEEAPVAEAASEEVELKVGMKVGFVDNGKQTEGVVATIIDDDWIKVIVGNKLKKVPVGEIWIVAED